MQGQYWSRVHVGMDVDDTKGKKIGKVGKVHTPAGVSPDVSISPGDSGQGTYLQVDTGLLGLGKHLYIPATHISDVVDDTVLLDVEKDRLDDLGWDQKPSLSRR